jgi:hypothetical protein
MLNQTFGRLCGTDQSKAFINTGLTVIAKVHTAGFPSANEALPSSNGTAVFLCAGSEADCTGKIIPMDSIRTR